MNVGFKISSSMATSLHGVMAMRKAIVWERLDKAVGTVEWMDMFLASKVVHLESGSLDLKPLMIFLASIPKTVNKP